MPPHSIPPSVEGQDQRGGGGGGGWAPRKKGEMKLMKGG